MDDTKKNEVVDLAMPSDKKIVSVDCGTMNLVAAFKEGGNVVTKSLRNMYLPIDKDQISMADLSKIEYVQSEDKIFIISEDAYRFANIFAKPVKRPMAMGLISPDEIDSIDILTLMIKQLIGKTFNGFCMYGVPAPSIDSTNDITYHKEVFRRIFSELGYIARPYNEAAAIIYSQCQNDNFTGMSFSWGAGQTNVSLCFKSNPVLSFSVKKGGDWIDESAARSLGTVPNRITSIKEKNTDLSNFKIGDRRESRIREAISYYYKDLINYVLDNVKKKIITDLANMDLPESIPIIVSGGTSLAKGFTELFTDIVNEYSKEFPFQIKEIRKASDALTCVAEGLLIKAYAEIKSEEKNDR